MKRVLIYIGILSALLATPVEPSDIGKLKPVQAVLIYKENDRIAIETDTEDKGIGSTAQEALQNLEDTTSGIIYLDTAKYLLLTKDTMDTVEELRQELKESVRVCMTAGKIDLTEAVKYLAVHGNLPKLEHWRKNRELPVLSPFADTLIFLKKVENNA